MSIHREPLVSVVTPVYNNDLDLEECIRSVIGQTYTNWEYIIVNNHSTDKSGEIATSFADRDPRIRVTHPSEFLPAIANHNFSLRQISATSKYCKVVFADDMIFPECIEKMVAVAEAHPSCGVVGAYALQGNKILGAPSPYPKTLIPGSMACRQHLLYGTYMFGTATSVLYRADLIRSRAHFYNEANVHADFEVCLEVLRTTDFGFVTQILTYTRERPGSLTSYSSDLHTYVAGRLHGLVTYGHDYLSDTEYAACTRRLMEDYYNFLAVNALQGRWEKRFWEYHCARLVEEGCALRWGHLAKASAKRILRAILNPAETLQKLRTALR